MNIAWTRGVKKGSQEDKDIRAAYAESFILRKRIVEVLNSKLDSEMKAAMSNDQFESPSWAFLQAKSIGYSRAIKDLIALLDADIKKV